MENIIKLINGLLIYDAFDAMDEQGFSGSEYEALKQEYDDGAKRGFQRRLLDFVKSQNETEKPATKVINNRIESSGNNNFIIQGTSSSQIQIGNSSSNKENKDALSILFIRSHPDDQMRIQSEFDTVKSKLKSSMTNDELEFLLPVWQTDYDKLLMNLKEHKPNVLHYSGHSEQEGICLVNAVTRETQLIENDELEEIFEGRAKYLKLVFLNSCFSSAQAKIISEQGIYVLGIKDVEIEDDLAVALSERFYLGIASQEPPISIPKAIKRGCRNFVKTYPDKDSYLSVWKDGVEVDYKTL